MDVRIKAVIFDIGGVVTKFPDGEYFAYLSNLSGVGRDKVKRIVDRDIPTLERGRMSTRHFEESIASRLGITRRDLQWYGYYKRYVTIDVDVMDLIKELHDEYVTAYITNIDASKYMLFKKLLGLELFDYRFASCDLHLRKPDPRIFRRVLARMAMQPKETVFIDNQIENVRGAAKVGMHAILYKGRRLLDRELSKLLD